MRPARLLDRLKSHDVAEPWTLVFGDERSLSFLPARHRAVHRVRYEGALASARPGVEAGRILRLLGRDAEARRELSAARDRGETEAEGWLWELDFAADLARGKSDDAGLRRAAQARPRSAIWPSLLALSLVCRSLKMGRRESRELLEEALDWCWRSRSLEPSSRTAAILGALTLRDLGRPRQAREWAGLALRLAPGESFAWLLPATLRLEAGDEAGFVAHCEAAIRVDEGVGGFERVFRARTGGWSRRDKEAAATEYLATHPQAYWMRVFRGDCRRSPEINDYQGALEDFEAAARARPDCFYAWSYLARARLSHSTPGAAREAADRAVRLAPRCGWVWVWRGEVRRRTGDLPGALSDLARGIALDPGYEFGYAWRGGALRQAGRLEEAERDLRLACELAPAYGWARQELGQALRQQGKTAQALIEVERACRLDPKFGWCTRFQDLPQARRELERECSRGGRRQARAWAWLGEVRLRQKDYARAEAALDRALRLEPGHAWALAWRGRALACLGRRARAMSDLGRSIALDPGYANSRAWRGRLRFERGDARGALEDLSAAYRLDAKSAWLLHWKGQAEEALGRRAPALSSYDGALGIEPRYWEAMLSRAALKASLGRPREAALDLEAAWRLEPKAAQAWLAGRAGKARAPAVLALAQRLLSTRRQADVETLCGLVLAGQPRLAEALRLRAKARRELGDYGSAASDLSRVCRLERGRPEARLALGTALWMAGASDGAMAEARRVLAGPGAARLRFDALILRSDALRSAERLGEAERAAAQAIEARPRSAWGWVTRAKVRRAAGRCSEALADVERALELAPGEAKALAWRGEILRKAGEPRRALASLKAATAADPRCAWALALRGEAQRSLGDAAAGWEDVRAAVAMDGNCSCDFDMLGAGGPAVRDDPAMAWVFAWRGAARRKKESWAGAGADLDLAVKLAPSCFWARAWRGELLLSRGRPRAALEDLDAALGALPVFTEAWVWKGRALMALRRWPPARRAFARAVALDQGCVWGWMGLGVCAQRLSRPRAAARALETARRLAPGLWAGAEARA